MENKINQVCFLFSFIAPCIAFLMWLKVVISSLIKGNFRGLRFYKWLFHASILGSSAMTNTTAVCDKIIVQGHLLIVHRWCHIDL